MPSLEVLESIMSDDLDMTCFSCECSYGYSPFPTFPPSLSLFTFSHPFPPPPPPPSLSLSPSLSPSSHLSLCLPLQCASQAICKHPLSVFTRSHSSPTINEALAETTVPCDTEREPLSSDETTCPVSAYNEWDPLEVSLTKMKLYYNYM